MDGTHERYRICETRNASSVIADRIIGHRGAAALAPENTLAGIRKASACGLKWVELDLSLLGDSTPVLSHDHEFDRCTNYSGSLSRSTLNDLLQIDAGSWFSQEWHNEKLPLLSDALLLCQALNLGLNLELKPREGESELTAAAAFQMISVYWHDPDKLIISSFDHQALSAYRALDAQANIGLLYDYLPERWHLQAAAIQACSIHCDCNAMTQADIQDVKASGYDLYCYTCNDPEQADRLFALGVDGIFTDNPFIMTSFNQPNDLHDNQQSPVQPLP